MKNNQLLTLYYIYDPMCSWCYGFQPCLNTLIQKLPPEVKLIKLLGGLAPDSDEPMPQPMRQFIAQNWQRIEATIPGIRFNYQYWDVCTPKRSTYPACRAVIAARQQGKEYEDAMNKAIQLAYYQQARNPSGTETLIQLASEIGLSESRFSHDLNASDTQDILDSEIQQARAMNATSFPSLVVETKGGFSPLPVDYNNPQPMLGVITSLL